MLLGRRAKSQLTRNALSIQQPVSSILFEREEFKTVMIRIPKTGSTSIVWGIFGGIGESDTVFHGPPHQQWLQYFVFGFVRNPFDRMVSAYLMFKKYKTATPEEEAFKERLTMSSVLDVIEDEQQDMTGEDYFSKLRRHVIPMTHPFFGLKLASKIYQFENFPDAYRELSERFEVPLVEVPHMRKTKRQHYLEYFNADDANRARKILQEDCDTFGYQF